MRVIACLAALAGFAALSATGGAAAAAETAKIVVGEVPSVPAAAIYLAVEKGYFKEAGVDVDLESINSSSTAMALLASNRMQVVGGGVAPNYWNALASGLPIILALERASSPLYHDVLIRKDLVGKIKTPADLKGRPIAEVSPGSSALYEVGQVLASAGLDLKDVDIKYIPFTQMGTALANGAVDAAFEVPPFGAIVAARGEGVKWLDPEKYLKVQPTSFVGEEILPRSRQRRTRFLPGLSPRAEPRRGRRYHVQVQGRDRSRSARQDGLAGAQPQWPLQCRERARSAGLVLQGRHHQAEIPGRAADRHPIRRLRREDAAAFQGDQRRG
jgi:hypothetical protein